MNKEELEKVEQLIEQKDSEQLKDLLAGLHPADIAELCNELDAEEARFIYLLLDNETAAVSYTHLRAHETDSYIVCRLLLEKKTMNCAIVSKQRNNILLR